MRHLCASPAEEPPHQKSNCVRPKRLMILLQRNDGCMIRGILFDKDGTLINFESCWHQVLTNTFSDLENDLLIGKKQVAKLKGLSGYKEQGFVKNSLVQHCLTSELINTWYKYLHSNTPKGTNTPSYGAIARVLERNALSDTIEITLLPGVPELLRYSKIKKIPVGVVTADSEKSTIACLKKTGIHDYFSFIGTDNRNLHPKPHPQMAQLFADIHGIKTTDLLVIGDSECDMAFAQNCGARFVGIKGQYNRTAVFRKNRFPVVSDLREIIAVIT